jgi:CRP/FNR family transcriptional regulator
MQKSSCDISSCFLCKHCQPEWRHIISLQKQTYTFRKGETLFAEGSPVEGLFFILSGAVKMHKHWNGEKELIIRFANGGDIVGLRGLGSPLAYPITATALEPTKACFITTELLEASFKTNPALTYEVLHFYATELQRTEQRMSDLAHMDVKGRIAGALLAVQRSFGTGGDGFLNLAISRQDIASYAGTIYETVFKVFTEWRNTGVITTEGKRIRILKEDNLRAFSGNTPIHTTVSEQTQIK